MYSTSKGETAMKSVICSNRRGVKGVVYLLLCLLSISVSPLALAEHVAYMSQSGNDSTAVLNDEAHPFATIPAAIAVLGSEGGTVSIARGTYSLTSTFTPQEYQSDNYMAGSSCVVVTTPVKIVGATGNPEDVVLKKDSSVASARVILLDNEGAVLQYVTVQDGYPNDNTARNGGNVLIGYNGGTVEDCILKDGKSANGNNTNLGGGNISLMAGRCARCVITGGKIIHYRPIGMNVMAAGESIVENCLITKGYCNTSHEAAQDEGAVALKDKARLVNCTVVDNFANRFSGVNILSANARAINCIISGNTVRYETEARGNAADSSANGVSKNTSNLGCYVNCATDLDTSKYAQLNDTCLTVAADDFVDPENGDWRLKSSSFAILAGSAYSETGAMSTTDLAGNVRTVNGEVDIGCYQCELGFGVRFSASGMSGVIPSTSEITFTAIPFYAAGTVTYTWNFDDGSAPLVTTDASVVHRYDQVGAYVVSVSATDGHDTVAYSFPSAINISSFSCEFAMLTTNAMVGADAAFRVENLLASGTTTFTWDFGDGSGAVETTELVATHAYSAAGHYTVSVVADAGADGSISYQFETTVDVVQKDIYVNRTGTATFPFDTPAKGAQTPAAALKYAVDGCVVHVCTGTYDLKGKETNVMRGVAVVGEGATPEETVFLGYRSNNGKRNIRVEHENALVANLTLDGGFADGATGGNLYLGAGTVTNCILRNGRSNSSGGGGGGAFVKGGVLTHCVITNSYLGNRGSGIALQQTGGRVSNCLIGYNKREWLSSRNAFSVCNVTGGVIDNCTIVGMSLLKYSASVPFQMGNKSDTGFNLGANARAYNCAIADFKYYQYSDSSTWGAIDEVPARCLGSAANFVNCVTDDAAPINETCSVGTTGTMFQNYANGDLTPGPALKNEGGAVEGYAFPSVDLAGLPRLNHAIDVGCYEKQPVAGMKILVR